MSGGGPGFNKLCITARRMRFRLVQFHTIVVTPQVGETMTTLQMHQHVDTTYGLLDTIDGTQQRLVAVFSHLYLVQRFLTTMRDQPGACAHCGRK